LRSDFNLNQLAAALPIASHQFVERGTARGEFFERDAVQRGLGGAVEIVELGRVRFIDVVSPVTYSLFLSLFSM